jgi:sec-independent protein translocase protein TatC
MHDPDQRLEAEFAALDLPQLSADFWGRIAERIAAENERWYDRILRGISAFATDVLARVRRPPSPERFIPCTPSPVLKKPDDDLFKDSTMTFGEHLEELRRALFKALIGLVVGCAVGLYFGAQVVEYINQPLVLALQRYYGQRAKEIVAADLGRPLTPVEVAAIDEKEMIFEPVFIEPQHVADVIQNVLPDSSAAFDVPRYSLMTADLPELKALETLATEEAGPAARFRSLLSTEAQKLLARWAKSAKSANEQKLDDKELRTLFSGLNQALARPDYYDEETFKGVSLSAEVGAMLSRRDKLDAAGLREFNWHLLHAAYPEVVKEPHATLVQILVWRHVKNDPRTRPQSLGVPEGFMIWLKASFITGFVIASPWVFYQLWMFVAAGLYPHEKKYVYIFLPFSLLLFLGGVYLALFWVFQPVLDFLFSNNAELGIDPDPRIGEWLSFFLMLPLGFGVAFQLPLVMLFMERIGIFTVNSYLAKWKIAVLSIVVLACVLTPADPVSFLFLGIPLLGLYFLGIAMCWFWPRKSALSMS